MLLTSIIDFIGRSREFRRGRAAEQGSSEHSTAALQLHLQRQDPTNLNVTTRWNLNSQSPSAPSANIPGLSLINHLQQLVVHGDNLLPTSRNCGMGHIIIHPKLIPCCSEESCFKICERMSKGYGEVGRSPRWLHLHLLCWVGRSRGEASLQLSSQTPKWIYSPERSQPCFRLQHGCFVLG